MHALTGCRPVAGVLVALDGFMNVAMEQAEEYVDGQLRQKYGDCFIRGNNGAWCTTLPRGVHAVVHLPLTPSPAAPPAVVYISAQKRKA